MEPNLDRRYSAGIPGSTSMQFGKNQNSKIIKDNEILSDFDKLDCENNHLFEASPHHHDYNLSNDQNKHSNEGGSFMDFF